MTATSVCSRREWVESTEGGSEGGDNLSDEAIEVGVGRALNVQAIEANVVDEKNSVV